MGLGQGDGPEFPRFIGIARAQGQQPRRGAQLGQVLNGLVGGAVLADADRVMGKHEHHRQLHEGRQADRRFHVVAEHQERRGVRTQVRQRHAIGDRAHGVFTDTEVQVASAVVVGTETPGAVERKVGLGRGRQVRRAAEQPRDLPGEGIQHVATGRAAGHALGVAGEAGQVGLPMLGHFPRAHAPQLVGQLWGVLLKLRQALVPLLIQRAAARQQGIAQHCARLIGHQKARVLRPAIRRFGQADFLSAQGLAMGRGGVVFVRRAVADHAVDHDQGRRAGIALEGRQRIAQGAQVVGVGHVHGVPAIGLEARDHVLAEGQLGVAFDADGVVVVEPAQVIQLQVPGQGRGFAADAFHHVAVAAQGVDVVVEQHLAVAVEALAQPASGHGHADAVGTALAEGAGGGFDASGHAVLGMARSLGAHLPELLDIVQADRRLPRASALGIDLDHAGQVQQRIQQHRRMPHRQHEAVTVGPIGMFRVVAQEAAPQRIAHRSQAHGRARMAGIGLLHGVHRQGAKGVDALRVDSGGGMGHETGLPRVAIYSGGRDAAKV